MTPSLTDTWVTRPNRHKPFSRDHKQRHRHHLSGSTSDGPQSDPWPTPAGPQPPHVLHALSGWRVTVDSAHATTLLPSAVLVQCSSLAPVLAAAKGLRCSKGLKPLKNTKFRQSVARSSDMDGSQRHDPLQLLGRSPGQLRTSSKLWHARQCWLGRCAPWLVFELLGGSARSVFSPPLAQIWIRDKRWARENQLLFGARTSLALCGVVAVFQLIFARSRVFFATSASETLSVAFFCLLRLSRH